jgi:hypothetical protein
VGHRPTYDPHSTFTQPSGGTRQQRIGHYRIVFTLESAEESDLVVVEPIVSVVDNGLDAANGTSAALGEKKRRLGMAEERMAALVEQLTTLTAERGHEVRIVPMKTVWDVDEPA